ncbi:MAG: hypothetical protein GXP40_05580, partial [Chloroflexi bacterium]|nr:hypothetical protein [Chloroflexota bacterium]
MRDSTPPQIDGTLSGTTGTNGWFVSQVEVSATAADAMSGLAAFEVSVDSGAWTAYAAPLTFSDGGHTVQFRATDNAGNVSEITQGVDVDTIPPAIDLSVNGTSGANGWFVSAVEVSASGSDSGSGLAALEYALDSGAWTAYTSPLTFSDGGHDYRFRAVDAAGNSTETRGTLNVDTTAPVIDLPSSWTLGRTVGYKVQDGGSGLAVVRVVIEDEDERYPKVAWQETVSGATFSGEIAWDGRWKNGTIAPPGEYYAWVKASDRAGNEGMRYGKITVAGASVPPAVAAATSTPTATPTPTEMAAAPMVAAAPTRTPTATSTPGEFAFSSAPPAPQSSAPASNTP